MFNDDWNYAASRLNGSLVRHTDQSIGVILVDDILRDKSDIGLAPQGYSFSKSTILGRDKNFKSIKVPPASICYEFGRLGYVCTSADSVFVVRTPQKRNFKQGIRYDSLGSLDSKGVIHNISEHFFFTTDFLAGISDCLNGKYPSLAKAENLLEERGGKVALSKSFAVNDAGDLFHREIRVGKDKTGNFKFSLAPAFNFLEEQLIEDLGNEQLSTD